MIPAMNERIGEQLVRLEMLSFEQAEEILKIQESSKEPRKFGEIALELGYITSEDLMESKV